MTCNFLIGPKQTKLSDQFIELYRKSKGSHIYIDSESSFHDFENYAVVINGYIQPRNKYFEKYRSLNKFEFIDKLYKDYQEKFIEYIKGNFIIILIKNDSIDIFTDHFGLKQCYIHQKNKYFAITTNVKLFKEIDIDLELDAENLAVKSLLHRIPGDKTQFKYIKKTKPASHVKISNSSIKIAQYWTPDNLLKLTGNINYEYSLNDFAELIKTNFKNFLTFQKPNKHTITLTGGKDSRTGLAALKKNGITPYGFTYGNPNSRDAVYAKKLADKICISHNIFKPPDTKIYFDEMANELISFGNPDISLHRSHRLYAFKEMYEQIGNRSAYYAGYMGGEFLMGIYYDNLIFTKFLTDFWDNSELHPDETILNDYFHHTDAISIDELNTQIANLRTFDSELSFKERQFYGIFDIGIPHHSQDVFLASKYFYFVYPFFIDIDFLEALFQSRYSFFFTDNKTKNLFKRYQLFEFNLNLQHLLFPDMDSVPFGKRGSYNSIEFLRGKYYWTAVKAIRYLLQRQKYPPTYVYGQSFRNFLLQHLKALNEDKGHVLHQYYDVQQAIIKLKSVTGNTNEEAMHKFTNIVQLYLQLKHFNI